MTIPPLAAILAGEGVGESDLTPEERTLRERARWLAEEWSDDGPGAGQAGTEMLVCRLHDERYAIELALLSAVQAAQGLTPIPGTPAFVAGMLNVRGTVVTVLDLARGLGLTGAPPPGDAIVLLTDCAGGGGQGQVGLLVHKVLGVSRLALGELDRAFSGNPAVRGIAEAGIVVLDLAALLADGRFEVAEEW
jgi:purine-binding chemotaxis protein CheW